MGFMIDNIKCSLQLVNQSVHIALHRLNLLLNTSFLSETNNTFGIVYESDDTKNHSNRHSLENVLIFL